MEGLTLGGSLLGATVGVVLQRFATHAIPKVGSIMVFTEDLDKMKRALQMIKALLVDDEKQVELYEDGVLKVWLTDFKSITYKADDLLDKLQFEWLKQEVEGHSRVRRQLSSFKTKIMFSSRIRKIQKGLDGILALASQYQLQKLNTRMEGNIEVAETAQGRVTTSLLGDEEVIGRDKEKDEIIKLLLSEHEGVQVLSIHGIGGVGKTTLARYVYNDVIIQQHFELKIWVCVSEYFDVKRLTSEILESTLIQSQKVNNRETCNSMCYALQFHKLEGLITSRNFKSFDELQNALKEELSRKMFLLILDDMWNIEPQVWRDFMKPFVTGRNGSKILVTSRIKEVVKIMSPLESLELEGLSRDHLCTLFKKISFEGSTSTSNQSLEEISEKIVDNLQGSPLAARTVGRLLNSNMSEEHWDGILNSELWEIPQNKYDIMPALRISYQHLPEALKPCFAFFSLFPKGYLFNELMLKGFWVASGFIRPRGTKLLEDIATTYINTLLSMCMIQHKGTRWSYRLQSTFVMHDLLHDLARIISKDEYFHVRDDGDLDSIPEALRHVNINVNNVTISKLKNFQALKNAQTFVVNESFAWDSRNNLNSDALHLICMKAKHLHILVIRRAVAEKLPYSIGLLKHLRYLDLSEMSIDILPESLCNLFNLQVLDVRYCRKLRKLPAGIIRLVNLRHLHLQGASVSASLVRGIGKLRSLQELEWSVSKEIGHTMGELKDMDNLRELCVGGLENVASKEEALEARLVHKKHLLELRLEGNMGSDRRHHDVLYGLQPHQHLRVLKIFYYGGVRFPSWMENGYFSSIQELVLWDCKNLEMLTSIQHPQLQTLIIYHCPNLKKIQHFIAPKLSYLLFGDTAELTLDSGFKDLNSLEHLAIKECPVLMADMVKKGWILPSSLRILEITGGCDPSFATNDEFGMSKCISYLPYLRTLLIKDCPHFTVLPTEVLQHMTSLKIFHITNCVELMSVDIQALISLHSFYINDCPKIQFYSDIGFKGINFLKNLEIRESPILMGEMVKQGMLLPSTLKQLVVGGGYDLAMVTSVDSKFALSKCLQNCMSLVNLFFFKCQHIVALERNVLERMTSLEWLSFFECEEIVSVDIQSLISLKQFSIRNCPKIQSLSTDGFPSSLIFLEIENCPTLKKFCEKDVGAYWCKISHIPIVYIDNEHILTNASTL